MKNSGLDRSRLFRWMFLSQYRPEGLLIFSSLRIMFWLGKFCIHNADSGLWPAISISLSRMACVMSCSQPDVMTAKPSIIVEFTASFRHSETQKTFRVLTCLFKHKTASRCDDETWFEWEKMLGTVSGWYQSVRIVIKALVLSHASARTKVPQPHTSVRQQNVHLVCYINN